MDKGHVTKEFALMAILHGACDAPIVGLPLSKLSTSHLIWAEDRFKPTQKEILNKTGSSLPLWLRSGYGSGSGDGYGDGYGSGSGSGYGYGSGSGYGDGYGDGDGSGSGYGKMNDAIYKLTDTK